MTAATVTDRVRSMRQEEFRAALAVFGIDMSEVDPYWDPPEARELLAHLQRGRLPAGVVDFEAAHRRKHDSSGRPSPTGGAA
jgi:hypothetical protein